MKIAGLYRPGAIAAELTDSVEKAAKRMRLHEVTALPVLQPERVIGIVTERDVTHAVAEAVDPRAATVAEVTTQHPLVATPGEEAQVVAMRMLEHGGRHLPVVEENRLPA